MARLTVTQLGVIGAEVALPAGLDIATAPGAADRPLLFAEIRAALLRHSVLAFRGQPIVSDEQHAAFARTASATWRRRCRRTRWRRRAALR